MSNDPQIFVRRRLGRFLGSGFGIVALCLSAQMAVFGFKHVKIDLTEIGQPEESQNAATRFANDCGDWQSVFGYRHICRKMIANDYFRNHLTDISDPTAKLVLENVLAISPLEPAYYYLRARIGLFAFDPTDKLVDFLRLSYLSGRGEQTLMVERFRIGFALWDALEKTDKSIVVNDYLKSYSSQRGVVYDLILSGPDAIFSEIAEILRYRDPVGYQQLLQGKFEKSNGVN